MLFQVGDIVTRNSYHNDTYFVIMEITGNIAYLKGINLRLYADSDVNDLVKVDNTDVVDDERITTSITNDLNLDRSEFFYLPGKVLHIDGDEDYLKRCMSFYKKLNIMAYGLCLKDAVPAPPEGGAFWLFYKHSFLLRRIAFSYLLQQARPSGELSPQATERVRFTSAGACRSGSPRRCPRSGTPAP